MKGYATVVFIAVMGLLILAMVHKGAVKEAAPDSLIIYFPEVADLPNKNEGTIVFEFNFPSVGFKVGGRDADMLMFLDSATLPGLQMGYDIDEKRIKAGLPMILSDEINLIDGKPHKLAYAFKKEEGKQWIYLDGHIIGEGEYTGDVFGGKVLGFAILESGIWIESPYPIKSEII